MNTLGRIVKDQRESHFLGRRDWQGSRGREVRTKTTTVWAWETVLVDWCWWDGTKVEITFCCSHVNHQNDQLLPCFFLSKKIMSFLETRNMHSPTSLSVANLTIVTGCHCVMLRSSPWLVRQDKDIVLFSLTCGSRLDLVDLLGGDPVDLLELSWSCWLVRQGSCLVLVDLLGGDLIRNDRTLASHHLGRARVVWERDKSVQVGHLPARLNLGRCQLNILNQTRARCNLPAPGRAKDVLEGAPSGPSRRSQSCNSASWSSPFPSPSEHKTGG